MQGSSQPRAATILIAEDYADNRELLRILLAAAHYNVREASNGRECLGMAREHIPDLIMIDLSMPVLDGWALIKELKSDALTAAIPCVAVTAHGAVDRERALKAGFDGYLAKPFISQELYEIVSKVLTQPNSAPQ
jgi:CheY-like chemotaxis protein